MEEIVDVAVPQSVEDGGGDSTCAFGAQPSTDRSEGTPLGAPGAVARSPRMLLVAISLEA